MARIIATDEYIGRQRSRVRKLRDNGVKVPLPVSDEKIKSRILYLQRHYG